MKELSAEAIQSKVVARMLRSGAREPGSGARTAGAGAGTTEAGRAASWRWRPELVGQRAGGGSGPTQHQSRGGARESRRKAPAAVANIKRALDHGDCGIRRRQHGSGLGGTRMTGSGTSGADPAWAAWGQRDPTRVAWIRCGDSGIRWPGHVIWRKVARRRGDDGIRCGWRGSDVGMAGSGGRDT